MVPLDGSKNSLRGFQFAVGIAVQSESSIVGLHVTSIPIDIEILPNVRKKIIKKSEEIIKKAELIAKKNNISFTGIIKDSNNVGNTIVAFAKKNKTDLIIIGSHGPDPEIEMFFGSVAYYILNKSKIPVAVVK